jgi:DUF971 family protein
MLLAGKRGRSVSCWKSGFRDECGNDCDVHQHDDSLCNPLRGNPVLEQPVIDDIPPPRSIKADPQALYIEWQDGVTHRLTWRFLRDCCPCATCRDKRSKPPAPAGEPVSPLQVISLEEARPLTVRSMTPVGNYAYGIDFTDGHTTGIYQLTYLRELGEEQAQTAS